MPFKRPASLEASSSSSSSSSSEIHAPSKRPRVAEEAKALPDINVYIVQAKLDALSLAELFGLAERHCKRLCTDAEDADVIVTAITMRRRLERNISWEVAKSKAVVTASWLRDSVEEGKPLPCDSYVALQDLREETIENCPSCKKKPCECEDTDLEEQADAPYPSPPRSTGSPPPQPSTRRHILDKEPEATPPVNIPENLLPPHPPLETNLSALNHASRYACQRASPLICPNQALAVELDIIKRSRALEGEERSQLSYSRAISTIKAYPRIITSRRQVEKLPHLGTKILGLIEEFLEHGKITEARTIARSERFAALSLFSSVYGIGPNTARRLYALGLRTLDDLEVYYGVDPTEEESQLVELEHREAFGKRGEVGLGETWVKIALGLRKDLEIKIPRLEVEEMNRVVMYELNALEPGCTSTIVGGYRRGKPESNDVDIVFTHPDPEKVKGLCKRFVRRLYEKGMVTHVMHLSGFHGQNPLRTTHWDSLEKALTVFILPTSSPYYNGTRRRLDLIFALPEVYWSAVIGWSGSIMFQRDLRLWAKEQKKMKFDSSGITRLYDSRPFYPKTEKEVFDLFGLEWVDPIWRNADV